MKDELINITRAGHCEFEIYPKMVKNTSEYNHVFLSFISFKSFMSIPHAFEFPMLYLL